MVYPSLITVAFDLFNCYEIEAGEQWLLHDLQLRCWEKDHLLWASLIGVPSIILWVIGIPFVGHSALRRNKETLYEEATLAKYKQLYQGLKPKTYFWEFVTLIRKLLLVSINVFISSQHTHFKVISLRLKIS